MYNDKIDDPLPTMMLMTPQPSESGNMDKLSCIAIVYERQH